MSKYTTQLRFICETLAGEDESKGLTEVDRIIGVARPLLFDNYEIFDAQYKPILETKIIKHFYTREISAETFALWKFWLNNKMKEIMPYYNQLYQSALLEFNPLKDTDYTVEHYGSGSTSGEYSETGKTNAHTKDETDSTVYDKFSDTPQGALTNVQNDTYLTNARMIITDEDEDIKTDTNSQTDGENSSMSSDQYFDTITGKRSGLSYSELLKQFRETFLNIDMLIIEELEELFIHLW